MYKNADYMHHGSLRGRLISTTKPSYVPIGHNMRIYMNTQYINSVATTSRYVLKLLIEHNITMPNYFKYHSIHQLLIMIKYLIEVVCSEHFT